MLKIKLSVKMKAGNVMSVNELLIPSHYENKLDLISTELAIKHIKDTFEKRLAGHLNLMRVSAPLFVTQSSGLNDNLNGIERPVNFDIKELYDDNIEIIHSLAKWKRMALKRYNIECGKGIYTDMNAIRRDEILDNLHSVYVDQWDWEKVISKKDRNLDFFKNTVRLIMKSLKETENEINNIYENLEPFVCENVYFITSQELENMYPNLSPKQREYQIVKKYSTVCIMQIGDILKSGKKHDGRAPDYDDWSLNGDILIYYPILDCVVEISSMGIRVDEKSLKEQLTKAGCEEKQNLPFHQMLLKNELPLTIGGGIGQSRICLLLLNKAHIGEVQVSLWSDEMRKECEKNNIYFL